MNRGIGPLRISDTPVAIIDFETTGLTAGYDRVVEVAIVRIDPGCQPRVVVDTLVNPMRPVSASEIHGITDDDVRDAPRFSDIAGDVLAGLNGCAVAAYNVYFDIKFLNAELRSVGIDQEPPHFCLMYLRPMLGLGTRCKLDVACQFHGVPYQCVHFAAHDALASASLFGHYSRAIEQAGIASFADLGRLKNYKFVQSFDRDPLPPPSHFNLAMSDRFHSRSGLVRPQIIDPERLALSSYWDTLKVVIADLDVTDEELEFVRGEQQRLGISIEQIRSLHARVYATVIQQFTSDRRIDDREARQLRRLHQCLAALGWAPGE